MGAAGKYGRNVIHGTLLSFLAKVVSVLSGTIGVILLARWLGPEEYGFLPLINAIISFIVIFSDFGIAPSVARYLAENVEHSRSAVSRILFDGMVLKLVFGLLASSLCVVFSGSIANWLNHPELAYLLPVGAILLFGRSAIYYLNKAFEGIQRLGLAAISTIIADICMHGLSVCFVLAGFGVIGAIWGRAIGILLGVLVGAIILYSKFMRRPCAGSESYLGRILDYSLPLLVISGSFYIYLHSDTLLVGYFLTTREVAIYNLPLSLMDKLHYPAVALSMAVTPLFGTLSSLNRQHQLGPLFTAAVKYICVLYIPLMLGLFIFSDPIIHYILGTEYTASIMILRVYAPFLLLFSIEAAISPIFNYMGKAHLRAILFAVSAVLNVLLNLYFIPRYGILGAAWTTQLTYSPLVLIYLIWGIRETGTSGRRMLVIFSRIGISCVPLVGCAYAVVFHIKGLAGLTAATLLCGTLYLSMLFITRTLTVAELNQLFREKRLPTL